MGLFQDQKWNFNHLNVDDIECYDDNGDGYISWWIVLIFCLVFFALLFIIQLYIVPRDIKKDQFFQNVSVWDKYGTIEKKVTSDAVRDYWDLSNLLSRKYGSMIGHTAIAFSIACCLILILLQKPQSPYYSLIPVFMCPIFAFISPYLSVISFGGSDISPDKLKTTTYNPGNMYQDLSASPLQVVFVFILQVTLSLIYTLSVFATSFPPCFNHPMPWILFVFAAILKSLYYAIDVSCKLALGLDDQDRWVDTLRKAKSNEEPASQDKSEKWYVTWGHPHPRFRLLSSFRVLLSLFCDIFINYYVEWVLAFLMVIQAANGDLSDFVLNFVAAHFIMQLDDYSSYGAFSTSFRLELVEEQNITSPLPPDPRNVIKNQVHNLLAKLNKEKSDLELKIELWEEMEMFRNELKNQSSLDVAQSSENVKLDALKRKLQSLNDIIKIVNENLYVNESPLVENSGSLSVLTDDIKAMIEVETKNLDEKISNCKHVIDNGNCVDQILWVPVAEMRKTNICAQKSKLEELIPFVDEIVAKL